MCPIIIRICEIWIYHHIAEGTRESYLSVLNNVCWVVDVANHGHEYGIPLSLLLCCRGVKRYGYLTIRYVSQYRGHDTIRIAIRILHWRNKKRTRCLHNKKFPLSYSHFQVLCNVLMFRIISLKCLKSCIILHFKTSTFFGGNTVQSLRISSLRIVIFTDY